MCYQQTQQQTAVTIPNDTRTSKRYVSPRYIVLNLMLVIGYLILCICLKYGDAICCLIDDTAILDVFIVIAYLE